MRCPHTASAYSRLRIPTFVAAALTLAGLTAADSAHSAAIPVRANLWAPNGQVNTIISANNKIYIGGQFSRIGLVCGAAVAIDPASATAQIPFPRVTGTVDAVEPDGNGGWYIGGSFSAVQGQPRVNLAQIDASGAVTAWNPRVNAAVHDIAVAGGVVYVVGDFWLVGADPRDGVAAFRADTGVVTHWNPTTDAFLRLQIETGNGKVYLSGDFYQVNGSPRLGVAEFTPVVPGDVTSGALTGLFSGSDPDFLENTALKLADGKLFIASSYTYGYTLRVFDLTTSSYIPFTHVLNGPAADIALDPANGIVFVGGGFSLFDGVPRANLAAFNLATGAVLSWNLGTDASVTSLALVRIPGVVDGLVVGGSFTSLGGIPRDGIGLVDPLVSTVLPWDANCSGAVNDVGVDATRIFAGGSFSIVNTVPQSNLSGVLPLLESDGRLGGWIAAGGGDRHCQLFARSGPHARATSGRAGHADRHARMAGGSSDPEFTRPERGSYVAIRPRESRPRYDLWATRTIRVERG